MKSLSGQFQEAIEDIKDLVDPEQFNELVEIFAEYIKSIQTQKTSSSLLLLNVEDILGFAQIKAGRFSKNVTLFDVKKAIQDIMSI